MLSGDSNTITQHNNNEKVFSKIASDLQNKGYSINPQALPMDLATALLQQLKQENTDTFQQAGVGREQHHSHNTSIRNDNICWIDNTQLAGQHWLDWTSQLQQYLNRRLFLGLFSFESHFAHYSPGHFYQRHLDTFKGQSNRILSLVAYLNTDWTTNDGGELILYSNTKDQRGRKINPSMATLVIFLSEEFPHEVLPATRDRYSIAGWFRVNTSTAEKIDPPM